ncbi:MAG TPA: GLPGLI family protein [Flavitalea sp.]|nr:GLPGLI family protein [Flavitalea sp.]
MTRLLFILVLTGFSSGVFCQFVSKGKIEYERKTNQHALMNEEYAWDRAAKNSLPKFVTFYFELSFDKHKTLYKRGRAPETRQNVYWGLFDGDNIIASDLDIAQSIVQKNIFGNAYLITDSIRKIDWKIGEEIRNIAGFDCRKAVGRIMDSIVVIAFYTDEILASGGPESFAGLPGMILGVAIPKMHTTWYATRLQLTEVSEKDLTPPRRGDKFSGPEFRQKIQTIVREFGKGYENIQWQMML